MMRQDVHLNLNPKPNQNNNLYVFPIVFSTMLTKERNNECIKCTQIQHDNKGNLLPSLSKWEVDYP